MKFKKAKYDDIALELSYSDEWDMFKCGSDIELTRDGCKLWCASFDYGAQSAPLHGSYESFPMKNLFAIQMF